VWQCQQCHRTHWRRHGCGDRHCPSCQHQRSRQWLQEQRRALLPVRYFHWVFTLPAALRPLILQNQAPLYRLLFASAGATLLQFGQQRFQAELGLTANRPDDPQYIVRLIAQVITVSLETMSIVRSLPPLQTS
jgi:hypothetical protein